ncbi:MAG: hypothetical protein ABFS03_01530 [Chloroflexota bacterium]
MFGFGDVVTYLGWGLRLVGMFFFGVSVGWFSWRTFTEPERDWKIQAVAYLGFLLFAGIVLRYASAGSIGVFLFSSAVTLLFLGLRSEGVFNRNKNSDEDE